MSAAGTAVSRRLTVNGGHVQRTTAKLPSKPRRWLQVEDDILREAVKEHKEKNWKEIAKKVPGRNHVQCLQRWKKVLKPGLIKGHWEKAEDELLMKLVMGGTTRNWGEVAVMIPGRTAKQCRERWCYNLDPNIKKGGWTPEEDALIIDSQARLGNRWAAIAQQLPGRTENAVKTRIKSILRAKAREWTPAEDTTLLRLRAELGNKRWDVIKKTLTGRTKNALQLRYRYLIKLKGVGAKSKRRDKLTYAGVVGSAGVGPAARHAEAECSKDAPVSLRWKLTAEERSEDLPAVAPAEVKLEDQPSSPRRRPQKRRKRSRPPMADPTPMHSAAAGNDTTPLTPPGSLFPLDFEPSQGGVRGTGVRADASCVGADLLPMILNQQRFFVNARMANLNYMGLKKPPTAASDGRGAVLCDSKPSVGPGTASSKPGEDFEFDHPLSLPNASSVSRCRESFQGSRVRSPGKCKKSFFCNTRSSDLNHDYNGSSSQREGGHVCPSLPCVSEESVFKVLNDTDFEDLRDNFDNYFDGIFNFMSGTTPRGAAKAHSKFWPAFEANEAGVDRIPLGLATNDS